MLVVLDRVTQSYHDGYKYLKTPEYSQTCLKATQGILKKWPLLAGDSYIQVQIVCIKSNWENFLLAFRSKWSLYRGGL